MTPNQRLKNLITLSEFQSVRRKLHLQDSWCSNTIFLFNDLSAILFQDLIQEYQTEVFLYDRKNRSATANLYGIASKLLDVEDEKQVEELTGRYMSSINFTTLGIDVEEKKKSLAYALALLSYAGDSVMAFSASDNGEFFTAPIRRVTSEWESCM